MLYRPLHRRRFLALGLISVFAAPFLGSPRAARAEAPQLDENDPTAKSLGYVHDASQVDVAKFPQKAGPAGASQLCSNCQFYTGAAGAEWGPCALFPGKDVSAKGWCSAWAKKA